MKKVAFFTILLLCVLTINSQLHSIIGLWQKQSVLEKTQDELSRVQKEHAELKKQMKQVEDPDFLEEEARNKLFLVKPGEKVVVLPSVTPHHATSSATLANRGKASSVFEQWLALFSLGGR
jgi:cell division protein FtsB